MLLTEDQIIANIHIFSDHFLQTLIYARLLYDVSAVDNGFLMNCYLHINNVWKVLLLVELKKH